MYYTRESAVRHYFLYEKQPSLLLISISRFQTHKFNNNKKKNKKKPKKGDTHGTQQILYRRPAWAFRSFSSIRQPPFYAFIGFLVEEVLSVFSTSSTIMGLVYPLFFFDFISEKHIYVHIISQRERFAAQLWRIRSHRKDLICERNNRSIHSPPATIIKIISSHLFLAYLLYYNFPIGFMPFFRIFKGKYKH